MLKLIARNTLALIDVLYVPNIWTNLVFVGLLGKVWVKVFFEFDKIVMTKNNIFFMSTSCCNYELFVLNASEIINKNACSFTYLIEFYNLWHIRLVHVNFSYVKKTQQFNQYLENKSLYRRLKTKYC